MAFDILAALRYPYQKNNWLNAWVLPATGIILMQAIVLATVLGIQAAKPDIPPDYIGYGLLPLMLLATILLSGFFWKVSQTLQLDGLNAACPSWGKQFSQYLVSGMKLLPYTILINILVAAINEIQLPAPPSEWSDDAVAAYSIGFSIKFLLIMIPLFSWAVVRSAPQQSFKQLFNPQHWFKQYNKPIWKSLLNSVFASVLVLAIVFVYLVVLFAIGRIEWAGFIQPFIYVPALVSSWHIITQGIAAHIPSRQNQQENLDTTVSLAEATV